MMISSVAATIAQLVVASGLASGLAAAEPISPPATQAMTVAATYAPRTLLAQVDATPAAKATPKKKPVAKKSEKTPVTKKKQAAKKTEKALAAKKPAAEPTAKDARAAAAAKLTAKVQAFYEKTGDFQASFEQHYTYKVLGRTTKSAGTVAFKKPGLMRWDYQTPREKRFVVDGDTLWVYTPEDHTVIKRPNFEPDSLSSSITFLWGKGRLADEFTITLLREDTLKLVPKTPQPGFASLRFKVEPATGKVLESTVIDAQGNRNRILFSDVKLDTKRPAKDFTFTPPRGVSVQILDASGLH